MKNVRVKVREGCAGIWWDIGIYEGRKKLFENTMLSWERKYAAIRNAKTMAKRIGIKYDPEIIKQHGC